MKSLDGVSSYAHCFNANMAHKQCRCNIYESKQILHIGSNQNLEREIK